MKVDLSMFGSHLRRFRPSHMPHLKIKDLTILDFRDLTPVVALLVPRNNVCTKRFYICSSWAISGAKYDTLQISEKKSNPLQTGG